MDSTALAADAGGLEEIVVTARRREERLIDAPLSISAITSADIDRRGLMDLQDVTATVPGVRYVNQGGQVPGRYDSAIRFRGMSVNSNNPAYQLGSLFIDGIYVLGGTFSIPLDDIERVEVIRGPQSAAYGRNTFGGAINYVSRTPSLTEYSGDLKVSAATYGQYDVSLNHEGPLIENRLAYRIGGSFYNHGATYHASDGGPLGLEQSQSAHLTLYSKPMDALSIKLHGFYAKDDDGPAAGGFIAGFNNDSCTGKIIATQDPNAPLARPRNYICGKIPSLGTAISSVGTLKIIDSNTSLYPGQLLLDGKPTFIVDKLVNTPPPQPLDVPPIAQVGLKRTTYRLSAAVNYDLPRGYTATLQGGYNHLVANWIRDSDLSSIENWYSRDPQQMTDKGLEFRIASPADKRFSWLLGVSHYSQEVYAAGNQGDIAIICTAVLALPPPGEKCTRVPFFLPNTLLQNTSRVKNTGYFAGISVRILDPLTLTVEGRYQKDTVTSAFLTPSPIVQSLNNFLPRVILRWQPGTDTTLYASYAKGVLQGGANAQVSAASSRELAQYLAQFPTAAPFLPAETLDMYEVGWKQQFLDRRLVFSLAGYQGKWKNQKGTTTVLVQEDCGSISHPVSQGGCPNGPNGQPAVNNDGSPLINTRSISVTGSSDIWGIEFEGSAAPTEHLTVDVSANWAKSRYTDFYYNFVTPISGFAQMKGNNNPRFPIYSGSVRGTYQNRLTDTWDWYGGIEGLYTGKTYADESNLSYCPGFWQGNARAGVQRDGQRLELFVRNLAAGDSWVACARWSDFAHAANFSSATTFQGIAVTPQEKRTFGVRFSYSF